MVYNRTLSMQSILFPPKCLICGAPGEEGLDLCSDCRDDLPLNHVACPVCASPLASQTSATTSCGHCQQEPPPFERSLSPYLFTDMISRLVGRFKFNGELYCGKLLSQLLYQEIEASRYEMPDLIIPVPLHASRLRERGFNQALELARPLAKGFSIKLDHSTLQRIKATPHQIGLHRNERRRNVKGAFEIRGKIKADHVALVDDVITTGSTLREIAGVLKRSGVSRIDVWALAKTPTHN